jgi:dienelactone hydrolase
MMPAMPSRTPTIKDGYRPDDAVDAWKRTLDFLAVTLKK